MKHTPAVRFLDFFRPVSAWSASRVRTHVAGGPPSACVLLDVRERNEFAVSHIPGAMGIPLVELPLRLGELPANRTVIPYCAAGFRSRAAAGVLKRAGFADVHPLSGGLAAWNGMRTRRFPSSKALVLSGNETLEVLIAMAWLMEDGARLFYDGAAQLVSDPYTRWAFQKLAGDERYHQRALEDLYRSVFLTALPRGFPYNVLTDWDEGLMEGGLPLASALQRVKDQPVADTVELAAALEANAYDLHRVLARQARDRSARRVFDRLSGVERKHAAHMLELFADLNSGRTRKPGRGPGKG
jgi:rhodanese-related sulfurtransferase/rubrerythrin